MMSQSMIFAVAALVSAVVLLLQSKNRLWAIVALVAAGLHLLIVSGLLRLSLSGISLSLVLGLALLVAGVMSWLKVVGKVQVSAATVVTLAGALMALSGFVR